MLENAEMKKKSWKDFSNIFFFFLSYDRLYVNVVPFLLAIKNTFLIEVEDLNIYDVDFTSFLKKRCPKLLLL